MSAVSVGPCVPGSRRWRPTMLSECRRRKSVSWTLKNKAWLTLCTSYDWHELWQPYQIRAGRCGGAANSCEITTLDLLARRFSNAVLATALCLSVCLFISFCLPQVSVLSNITFTCYTKDITRSPNDNKIGVARLQKLLRLPYNAQYKVHPASQFLRIFRTYKKDHTLR